MNNASGSRIQKLRSHIAKEYIIIIFATAKSMKSIQGIKNSLHATRVLNLKYVPNDFVAPNRILKYRLYILGMTTTLRVNMKLCYRMDAGNAAAELRNHLHFFSGEKKFVPASKIQNSFCYFSIVYFSKFLSNSFLRPAP